MKYLLNAALKNLLVKLEPLSLIIAQAMPNLGKIFSLKESHNHFSNNGPSKDDLYPLTNIAHRQKKYTYS